MIVLDTNVVYEAMHRQPDESVIRWLNDADSTDLFLSSITDFATTGLPVVNPWS